MVTAAGVVASAIVNAAATEAWPAARARVLSLFGRGGRSQHDVARHWADETAAGIERVAAEDRAAVREQLAADWARRLSSLATESPDTQGELAEWAERLHTQQVVFQRNTHRDSYTAYDRAQQNIAPGGTINIGRR